MTSRYSRGYAFTPNTEREGLDNLRFYYYLATLLQKKLKNNLVLKPIN